MIMDKNDGFPETYHILPTPTETARAIGSFIKRFCVRSDRPSNHFVPFEDNTWKQAEALHDDGATSPSNFDTFDRPK